MASLRLPHLRIQRQGASFIPGGVQAFTLLELIVAVSIVCLLTAFVTSVAMRMIKQSEAAKCISNLRGLSQLASIYAADHDNRPPPNAIDEEDKSWPRLLLQTMVPTLPNADAAVKERMKKRDAQIFWCPSFVSRYGSQVHPRGLSSYGLHSYYYHHKKDMPPMAVLAASEMMKQPFIICAKPAKSKEESKGASYVTTFDDGFTPKSSSGAAYYHRDMGNMVFLDGHVETLKSKDAVRLYEEKLKSGS